MRPFGVLALQGDFAAHLQALRELDVPAREVRRVAELPGLAGLVIPGGESTTLLNLMQDEPWFEALRRFLLGHGASQRLSAWSDTQLIAALAVTTLVFAFVARWGYGALERKARREGRLDQTTMF